MAIESAIIVKLLSSGINVSSKEIRKKLQEQSISSSIPALETKFHQEFQKELRQIAEREDESELYGIAFGWDSIAPELDNITLPSTSTHDAIEVLLDEIESCNDISLEGASRNNLKYAISEAYISTLNNLQSDLAGTDLGHELQIKQGDILLDEISSVLSEVEEITQSISKYRPYDVYKLPEERKELRSSLGLKSTIPYVKQGPFEGAPSRGKTLLLAPSGAGKTRTLQHLIDSVSDISHAIVPRDELSFKEDVRNVIYESFEQDVLLVWDDIHAISESTSGEAFEAMLNRLEYILSDEQELHVFATAQLEKLNKIPGDPVNGQGIWSDFKVIQAKEWSRENTRSLVDTIFSTYDIEVSDPIKSELISRAVGNTAPLYLDLLGKQYAGKELLRNDLEDVPVSIENAWRHHLRNLASEDTESLIVLEASKLLYDLGLTPINSVLEGVFVEVLGQNKRDFRPAAEFLHERGWLGIKQGNSFADSGAIYNIHDTQLQSVDRDLSEFIGEITTFFESHLDKYTPTIAGYNEKETQALIRVEAAIGLDLYGVSFEEIQPLFRKSLQEAPESPNVYNYYAEFIQPYDLDKCMDIYEEALSKGIEDSSIHYNYGCLLNRIGEHEEARQQFKTAISLDPSDGSSYTGLGLVDYEEFKKRDGGPEYLTSSVNNLEKAIKLRNNPIDALNLLGCAYRQGNDYTTAVKLLEAAENLEPEWIPTYINLSSVWKDQDKLDKAIAVLERGTERLPNISFLHGRLGGFLWADGQGKRAREELHTAIQLDEKNASAHFNLSLTLQDVNMEKSEFYKNKALELVGKDPQNMARIPVPKYTSHLYSISSEIPD